MNGILAQTAALAAHARARALDVRLGGDDAYWSQHSTFQFVRRLSFRARKSGFLRLFHQEIATTPPAWMATLPDDAEVTLAPGTASRILYMAAGLMGDDCVAVSRGGHRAVWIPGWRVVAKFPETRIWSVTYFREFNLGGSGNSATLDRARDHLRSELTKAIAFTAADSDLSVWKTTFEQATAQLDAARPVAPYHPDILPQDGYSLAARQLLAASVTAFVFGGMGSWNDMRFPDKAVQAEYIRLTRVLHAAVIEGVRVAVNRGIANRHEAR